MPKNATAEGTARVFLPDGDRLFHLAFHVRDLDVACGFDGRVPGCTEGRSTHTWVGTVFQT